MTGAPERIWAEDETLPGDPARNGYWEDCPETGLVEYVRADLAAPRVRARVRALVWTQSKDSRYRDGWNPNEWHVKGASCQYSVLRLTKKRLTPAVLGKYRLSLSGYYMSLGDFDTLEDAKAAAQADYEARILAALEPQP